MPLGVPLLLVEEFLMIRLIILNRLATAEKELGVSMDYLRHILRVSLRAFFRFLKFFRLSEYRRALPAAPYHVARIVATRDEDCGPCLQIEVALAKKDGVPADVLRAVLAGEASNLSEDLADVYRFTEAVVRASGEEDLYRERVRRRYGEEGLVELALAMAWCRVFPITKRALGHAMSCAKVRVEV
jgi:alkylhydroperoxidase family enzyme